MVSASSISASKSTVLIAGVDVDMIVDKLWAKKGY